MSATTLIGYIAGILTTIAFFPQAWRVWRTRSVHDISLPTFCIYFCGISLWLVYGIRLREQPIIIANAVSLLLVLVIIIMKLRFDAKG